MRRVITELLHFLLPEVTFVSRLLQHIHVLTARVGSTSRKALHAVLVIVVFALDVEGDSAACRGLRRLELLFGVGMLKNEVHLLIDALFVCLDASVAEGVGEVGMQPGLHLGLHLRKIL